MADSYAFGVRIVSIDYYMSPPIPDIDICYSSFQGGKVNEVPVIRVYGSTPAGQKTCLHIHRALPYLYVPCTELSIQSQDEDGTQSHGICLSLEKALKLKSSAGSKRQHVHGCSIVRARKLYGYHSSEEPFAKIYLYFPHDVSRAANLLLRGAVLGNCLQPHESHIPFLLQFMIDYNLYGMGFLYVSKMKFRHPIPDALRKAHNNGKLEQEAATMSLTFINRKVDSSDGVHLTSPIWLSSTIPHDWLWHGYGDLSASDLVKRQSMCELEVDTSVDEILNHQFKMYSSFSQSSEDVKMVQSLIPIWEEEYERTGSHEAVFPSEAGKPLPEDVLKILSCGLEFKDKLWELSSEAKTSSTPLGASTRRDSLIKHEAITSYTKEASTSSRGTQRVEPFQSQGTLIKGNLSAESHEREEVYSQLFEGLKSASKGSDEALGLLKWLASSQAAEDVNSDDELVREIILSPLMPATNIDVVLEKASKDYENESQQECQDILDSINLSDFDKVKEKDSLLNKHTSSDKMSPQLDGSSDYQYHTTSSGLFEKGGNKNSDSPLEHHLMEDSSTSISNKRKREKPILGSLSLSVAEKVDGVVQPAHFKVTAGNGTKMGSLVEKEICKSPHSSIHKGEKEVFDSNEHRSLVGCSVRDLMRKKRCQKHDPPECRPYKLEPLFVEVDRKQEALVYASPLGDACLGDFPILSPSDQQKQLSKSYSCRETSDVEANAPKEHDNFFERLEVQGGIGENTVTGNLYGSHRSHSWERSSHESMDSEPPLRDEPLVVKSEQTDIPCVPVPVVGPRASDVKLLDDYAPQKMSVADVGCWSTSHEKFTSGNDRGKGKIEHQNSGSIYEARSADFRFEGSRNVQTVKDSSSASGAAEIVEDCTHFVCMTLSKKPPKIRGTDGASEDSLQRPAIANCSSYEDGNNLEGTSDQDEKGVQNSCHKDHALSLFQGSMGVPRHYQNDGSILHLLSPLLSPPSRDCISRWLLHNDRGTSNRKSGTALMDSSSAEERDPIPRGPFNRTHKAANSEVKNFNDIMEPGHQDEGHLNLDDNCKSLQDLSQISGPSEKRGPTPISQLGFRDPASIGGGQQLTMLSVEVQAECRGDLRPDPRFDAINIIVVVIEEDDDRDLDTFVLLRGNVGSSQRCLDGIDGCKVFHSFEETKLLDHFVQLVCSFDPDILLGWDIQGGSLGFLAERASHFGINLVDNISRTPSEIKTAAGSSEVLNGGLQENLLPESSFSDSTVVDDTIIEDEWGRTHASGIHVGGRVVLNVWRLMRSEVKLNLYTIEAVSESVLRRKVPFISNRSLMAWFSSGPGKARFRCIQHTIDRAKLSLEIINQLDLINRTSELARIFGIDFFSVLSRGSQYRVESMLLRLAHTQNYLAISPGSLQVASQPAMECLPLVMEPESGFYSDPVVVLDFQSLYPSMIIAYNLCYSTCLGKVLPLRSTTLGVSSISLDTDVLQDVKRQILLTPNGVLYAPSKIRKGILPRLLEEILSTRIMVKQAMKKLAPSQLVLQRIFNARQLALKLIANVTYGYTAAGFSGRMPCAELADSIVQCGRRTLESAISYVNTHDKWKAKVIYGDTDSMFVLLQGRTIKDAFKIGQDIALTISAMNPVPVTLKMEKVYGSCFLLTKKRYVGYSYEKPDQVEPVFDAKGIETVRRDTCAAVSKTMEHSLRLYFENQDLLKVKFYLQRQWKRILSGRVSLQDFVFAKEVRLGTYRSLLLPPAAIVATKAMKNDPRAEPRYAERIPYVVVHGLPGARLVDMVVDPLDLLAIDSPFRLNDLYYIKKQIIPALQRVFGLVQGELSQWFLEMHRPVTKHHFAAPYSHRTRIDYYYLSKHCMLCGEVVHTAVHLCDKCSSSGVAVSAAVTGRTSKLEREMQHLAAICQHCGGGDPLLESGVKCTSLACSVFFERRKVQKDLQGLASAATSAGFYPRCMIEWF